MQLPRVLQNRNKASEGLVMRLKRFQMGDMELFSACDQSSACRTLTGVVWVGRLAIIRLTATASSSANSQGDMLWTAKSIVEGPTVVQPRLTNYREQTNPPILRRKTISHAQIMPIKGMLI